MIREALVPLWRCEEPSGSEEGIDDCGDLTGFVIEVRVFLCVI